MKVKAQCIVKTNNDVYDNNTHRKNEDAWGRKENVVAISDGAGGVGILADVWSQKLVNNIPKYPFENVKEIDKWVITFWEEFYKQHSKKLSNDLWKINKFEDEGSLATLSAIWKIGENEFIYQSYGDSSLFIYNNLTGELKIQDNINSINFFGTSPPLINWKTEEHNSGDFFEQKISLNKNEEIILATDGIAMYIFGAYTVFNNALNEDVVEKKMLKIVTYFKENPISDFKIFMTYLKESLRSISYFKKITSDWYLNKFLPNDDYTLVWIENGERALNPKNNRNNKAHKLIRKAMSKLKRKCNK